MNSSEAYHQTTHTPKNLRFFWYDYLIFVIMLSFSTSVGIYYGCFGSKQGTVKKYLLGGKKMTVLPIALSVAVGHFSSITITGVPADGYKFGTYFLFAGVSMIILTILTIYLYFNVFFELQITSAYEYLEKRFDTKTRILASLLYILSDTLLLPVIAYGPSLALSTVTGIKVTIISIVLCSICVFYTTIGGLKTVVWTDFYQLATILLSLTVITVIGITSSGGISNIWNKAVEGKRLEIFNLDPNPTRRESIWIYLVGVTIHWTSYVSLSQSAVQKFLALPTLKDCVRSLIYFTIIMNIIVFFVVTIALLMYEKYSECDLLLSKKIQKHEQMVPYYVMDITGHISGVAGLFLVSLVCAALSTISSSLNALSGVIYKDFISKFTQRHLSEKKAVGILKITVIVIGIIITCLVSFIEQMGDLVPVSVSFPALAGGPLFGVFTMGVLFPKANAKGAFYGGIISLICMGSLIFPLRFLHYDKLLTYPNKPLSIGGCDNFNGTLTNNTNIRYHDQKDLNVMFQISHYYHCAMGAGITIIVGLIISYATNKNEKPVDKKLLCPIGRYFLPKETENKSSMELLKRPNCDTYSTP